MLVLSPLPRTFCELKSITHVPNALEGGLWSAPRRGQGRGRGGDELGDIAAAALAALLLAASSTMRRTQVWLRATSRKGLSVMGGEVISLSSAFRRRC